MKIKYLYPYWGSEGTRPYDFLNEVLRNEFDGIEIVVPSDVRFTTDLMNTLSFIKRENPDFTFVAQQWSEIKTETPKEYLERINNILNRYEKLKPDFINSHTGKDHFSFEENCKIIQEIEKYSIKTGIPVYHELHRGRFTFHSYTTLSYLNEFPNLKFVADFSHWCNVSESILQDQNHIIEKVIPHIEYIHARIGFEQGPQVNDPFAPEWELHVECFLGWWQRIVDHHKENNQQDLYITTEFGPVPYMPVTPFEQKTLSNQKEINMKLRKLLKQKLKL